jgi:hypothetical protein
MVASHAGWALVAAQLISVGSVHRELASAAPFAERLPVMRIQQAQPMSHPKNITAKI